MAKKKSFIDNPALHFISTAEPEETRQEERELPASQAKPAEKPPEGYKLTRSMWRLRAAAYSLSYSPAFTTE